MGCMRNFLAMIGCVTVMVALAIAAWLFRDEIGAAYERFQERQAAREVASAVDTVVGIPSPDALARAVAKEAELRDPRGPAYVELSADEFAALVASRLDPGVRMALDSVTITLARDRVWLGGQLRLDILGRDLLGPIADVLGGRQPLRAGGDVAVPEAGTLAWSVDEFMIRDFAIPGGTIPRLVDQLGGDSTGAFLIPIPETAGDVRVRPTGIVFYRAVGS